MKIQFHIHTGFLAAAQASSLVLRTDARVRMGMGAAPEANRISLAERWRV